MARTFERPKLAMIGAGQIGGNLALMAAQKHRHEPFQGGTA